MKEFIHTLSFTAHLFTAEKEIIEKTFRESFFFNSEDKILVLSKYADRGVRIQIKYNPKIERRFDKEHRECKIEIIVNPAKLMYPGEPMCKLFTADEYTHACTNLKSIIEEMEKLSGVSLWKEVKIKRIDVTKDVETPSEKYSDEIIRLAKKSMCKSRCHIWKPTQAEVDKKGWLEKDSILFYNHNQGVNSKIYNKAVDLKNQNPDYETKNGLIRFETSLTRKFLKENNLIGSAYIEIDEVVDLLCKILESSEYVLKKYIANSFFEGRMLSKKLQQKVIRRYCNNKKGRYEKMLSYRDTCNKNIKLPENIDAKKKERMNSHFKFLQLSPIYTSPEFECIPAFSEFLEGKCDTDSFTYG